MRYFIILLFFLECVRAQEIRFPDEELNQEVVYPVFENNPRATMNRRVTLKYKGDFFASGLFRGDEPFYNRVVLHAGLGFYFNEIHGISLSSFYFSPGRSSSGSLLTQGVGSAVGNQTIKYDATLIPHPQSAFFLNYEITPFYGKHSFSKKLVTNFNISFSLGLGAVVLAQNENAVQSAINLRPVFVRPALWLGLKQKIFIGSRFYFHGDFGFLTYYGSNPVNQNALNRSIAVSLEDVQDQFQIFEDDREILIFRNKVGAGIGVLL